MIPLAHWLSDRETGSTAPCCPEFPLTDDVVINSCTDDMPRDSDSKVHDDLREALRRAEEVLMSERVLHGERERQWREAFGSELINALKTEMEHGLTGIRRDIEAAVACILKPFLEHQTTARTVTALIDFIDAELRNRGETLVELHAPPDFHEFIQPSLDSLNISLTSSNTQRVDLVFGDGTARFELLASRWIATISETTP